jgi:hypothetical protein
MNPQVLQRMNECNIFSFGAGKSDDWPLLATPGHDTSSNEVDKSGDRMSVNIRGPISIGVASNFAVRTT